MNWYTAECLFRAVHESKSELFELRYFLLQAENDRSASSRSLEIARQKQHTYRNAEGVKVDWVLERVVDIKEILSDQLSEGTEVYYKYLTDTELQFVNSDRTGKGMA